MKIKILSLILAIIVSVMLNCSCTSKSAQEIIEDAYSKEYCQQIMNEVLSKYMIVDWDSIARQVYIPEDNSGSMLIVDGYGKCRSYGNERFHVSSVWRINEGAKDCNFSTMQVRHKELGDIISINGPEDYMNSIMDSTEFAQKLAANKVKKSEVANERANMVALAYQNKTKVHFGMTAEEYKQCGREFQRNFIDGLIGPGAFEKAKPSFARGKFVGFEINSGKNQSVSHKNIIANAEVTKSRKLDGNIRFDSYETNYVCKLYNLQIFEQTDGASHDCHETIKVWWNSYLKIYN